MEVETGGGRVGLIQPVRPGQQEPLQGTGGEWLYLHQETGMEAPWIRSCQERVESLCAF